MLVHQTHELRKAGMESRPGARSPGAVAKAATTPRLDEVD